MKRVNLKLRCKNSISLPKQVYFNQKAKAESIEFRILSKSSRSCNLFSDIYSKLRIIFRSKDLHS